MTNKYESENIGTYLKGELSGDSLKEFERKLQYDKSLQEEVELEKNAQALTKVFGRSHLKARLNDFEEMPQQKVRIVPLLRKITSIAAAILLITLAGYVVLDFEKKPLKTEAIFEEYFEPYRAPISIRSSTTNANQLWTSASEQYALKNFEAAAHSFGEYLKITDSASYLAHFYLGASLLAQKNPKPAVAIAAFSKVLENDNDYQQQAKWHIGLAYLKLGERDAAIAIFEEISESKSYKQEAANKIIKALK